MTKRKRSQSQRHDEDDPKFEALRAALKEGVDALDRGDYDEIDETELDQYLAGLSAIAHGRRPKPRRPPA